MSYTVVNTQIADLPFAYRLFDNAKVRNRLPMKFGERLLYYTAYNEDNEVMPTKKPVKQPRKAATAKTKEPPTIWEPSTKEPDKAIDEAFGLWVDNDESDQTESEARAYRNKLWRSERS